MDYDVAIIGAGVVGLSCAYHLSKKFSTIVIEKNPSYGQETSSRNSEVIHSGIYYKPGSLKARLCVDGNRSIYQWCKEYNIQFAPVGKLIVATNDQEAEFLQLLLERGKTNGVENLKLLGRTKAQQLEPSLKCTEVLFVPTTGILNSHQFMDSLFTLAKQNGADFAFHHKLTSISNYKAGYKLEVTTNVGEKFQLEAKFIVNSAGLESDSVAKMAGLDIDNLGYKLIWAKGHYFRLSSRFQHFTRHLIYPVPPNDGNFLGIHLTLELSGDIKFGPDLHFLNSRTIDYSVPDELRKPFHDAISRYLTGIALEDLNPDQAGIRPKLAYPKSDYPDFIIAEESSNGLPGFINLIGIESPGLTSSLEIGKLVANLLD
ncbi:MAG: NAD(P)/FAD-dependent oxidoreductase [Candidatus Kapaibacteriales bacterium]